MLEQRISTIVDRKSPLGRHELHWKPIKKHIVIRLQDGSFVEVDEFPEIKGVDFFIHHKKGKYRSFMDPRSKEENYETIFSPRNINNPDMPWAGKLRSIQGEQR